MCGSQGGVRVSAGRGITGVLIEVQGRLDTPDSPPYYKVLYI